MNIKPPGSSNARYRFPSSVVSKISSFLVQKWGGLSDSDKALGSLFLSFCDFWTGEHIPSSNSSTITSPMTPRGADKRLLATWLKSSLTTRSQTSQLQIQSHKLWRQLKDPLDLHTLWISNLVHWEDFCLPNTRTQGKLIKTQKLCASPITLGVWYSVVSKLLRTLLSQNFCSQISIYS